MAQKGLIKTKLSPYFTSLAGGEIQCELCPKRCRVQKGERGICRVRENREGKCYSLVYRNPCAFHLDPIERNPFFHVLPGTRSLALATAGCNFWCKFCQTWEISQASPEDVYSYEISPELVIDRAKQMKARSVAYTFVEPVIFYEYMMEIGSRAKEAGLLSLIHSNGFINRDPLKSLSGVLDAANIDLKGAVENWNQCSRR
jgi:pyruvate formate lyase activating enzyme